MAASMMNGGGRFIRKILHCSSIYSQRFSTLQANQYVKQIDVCTKSNPCNSGFLLQRALGYSTLVKSEDSDILYKNVDIELKGHDPMVLKSYGRFLGQAAQELDVDIYDMRTPTKKINRMSLLKSVHVHKKHFVQYETRTHYKTIHIKDITGSTADTYMEYIQRNLPEGVFMKITKCQLETLPDHIKPPDS